MIEHSLLATGTQRGNQTHGRGSLQRLKLCFAGIWADIFSVFRPCKLALLSFALSSYESRNQKPGVELEWLSEFIVLLRLPRCALKSTSCEESLLQVHWASSVTVKTAWVCRQPVMMAPKELWIVQIRANWVLTLKHNDDHSNANIVNSNTADDSMQERRGRIVLWRPIKTSMSGISFWSLNAAEFGWWGGSLTSLICTHWASQRPRVCF